MIQGFSSTPRGLYTRWFILQARMACGVWRSCCVNFSCSRSEQLVHSGRKHPPPSCISRRQGTCPAPNGTTLCFCMMRSPLNVPGSIF
ncbi:unnamed protein product [Ectocarpus sp. 8 AP-2014]